MSKVKTMDYKGKEYAGVPVRIKEFRKPTQVVKLSPSTIKLRQARSLSHTSGKTKKTFDITREALFLIVLMLLVQPKVPKEVRKTLRN